MLPWGNVLAALTRPGQMAPDQGARHGRPRKDRLASLSLGPAAAGDAGPQA